MKFKIFVFKVTEQSLVTVEADDVEDAQVAAIEAVEKGKVRMKKSPFGFIAVDASKGVSDEGMRMSQRSRSIH